ncbi:MAG: hypothetical protein ACLT0Y_00075 [Christensenellales bacterium]
MEKHYPDLVQYLAPVAGKRVCAHGADHVWRQDGWYSSAPACQNTAK